MWISSAHSQFLIRTRRSALARACWAQAETIQNFRLPIVLSQLAHHKQTNRQLFAAAGPPATIHSFIARV